MFYYQDVLEIEAYKDNNYDVNNSAGNEEMY